jgi:uncharacterized membrane protein (UPF0182 family)
VEEKNIKNNLFFTWLFLTILAIIFIFKIAGLISDYLWFKELGYTKTFMISFEAAVLIFFVFALIFFLFIMLNLWFSYKSGSKKTIKIKTRLMVSVLVAYIAGSIASSNWLTILQYFRQTSFNLADPIFAKDVSFYVFSLPYYFLIWKFAFAAVIITTIFVFLDYFQALISNFFRLGQIHNEFNENFEEQINKFPKHLSLREELTKLKTKAIVHLSVLVSLFFILLGIRHYLSIFSIMYSGKGIVVGAGYTDVMVYLPAIRLLMIIALVIAIIFFVWMVFYSKQKKKNIINYSLIVYVLVAFIGLTILPNIFQSLKVSPNEINLEKPYIENNINFTRIAYGLSDVEEKEFTADMLLNEDIVSKANETIDNVRVIDWRPLTTTYKQTQEIRLYYDLSSVDIDRYSIDGKNTQVMIAPRELSQVKIPDNAKTWVNLHMIYTHGYGLVMNPVNNVTDQGLPNYLIKDIPPVYTIDEPDIKVNRPEIYFGEKDNDFVIVSTNTNEFNYPKGDINEYNHYNGTGGVVLDKFWKKLIMALRFGDVKMLMSTDITSESKIMFTRNIKDRVYAITPFLRLDDDPYLVIDKGRLFWILDGYTVTSSFPYSQKYQDINYMRNSVKIVLDAYNGDVTYYIIDKNDPLIMTYAKVFPGQFKYYEDMPAGLKKHIRYPEGLFKVQSAIYDNYHMLDANVFYNKEDAWQIPNEIYGTRQQVPVEPYYIIMKLPGEEKAEFILMITFTPIKKDNMVAWMAARMDGNEYGKLFVYKFPKDKLAYGPSQIEAKIDQDSIISQQLTLWGQQGSRVTRGNMLVIPIANSLLYVEPLYLQSEQGQLPELKRVIVSDGDKVVMGENLGLALEALFNKRSVTIEGQNNVANVVRNIFNTTTGKSSTELINEANTYYAKILDSMKTGDWAGIGTNIDNLGKVLDALKQENANHNLTVK